MGFATIATLVGLSSSAIPVVAAAEDTTAVGVTGALATISVWKLIILGIFGIIALGILMAMVVATSLFLSPSARAFSPFSHAHAPGEPLLKTRLSTPTRILGWGITLLFLGLGIVAGIYGVAEVSLWGLIGMILLSCGLGLIVFYLIAARKERYETPGKGESQGTS
jgi:hypothetical protein